MPIYEYRCKSCGKTTEVIQKMTDKPLKDCPKCGGTVEKLISRSSFQLKGTGWYASGYSSKGKSSESDSKGSASKAASSSSETSSESSSSEDSKSSESSSDVKSSSAAKAKKAGGVSRNKD